MTKPCPHPVATWSTKLFMLLLSTLLVGNAVTVVSTRWRHATAQTPLTAVGDEAPPPVPRAFVEESFARTTSSKWLGMHVWPVFAWLALGFLQTWAWLRSIYLRLHRLCGRLYLLISIYMSVGYIMMLVSGERLPGVQGFAFRWGHPEKAFTFQSATVVLGSYWFVCMYNLYASARAESLVIHKYWAYQFLAAGLAVGTMRLLVFGYIVWFLVTSSQREISKETFDVLFGYSLWMGFIFNCAAMHIYDRGGSVWETLWLTRRTRPKHL